jgi:hypothetical protein
MSNRRCGILYPVKASFFACPAVGSQAHTTVLTSWFAPHGTTARAAALGRGDIPT